MPYLSVLSRGPNTILTLERGKVNAIDEAVVDEIQARLVELEANDSVRAIILTGVGSFFSFGFDVPELYGYSREAFTGFLLKFTSLYKNLFLYPKPVVAALNGHTIAGGCMLANACDYRLMITGKAKVSLNEIAFGAAVFASSVEILKYWVGPRIAQEILLGGEMHSAETAKDFGLVDEVVRPEQLAQAADRVARRFAGRDPAAFAQMKRLLRLPFIQAANRTERQEIDRFVDIWYSSGTRQQLQKVLIRE